MVNTANQYALSSLRGVGEAMLARLNSLGLYRIQDVLLHAPLRYENRTQLCSIAQLQHGEDALVEGVVQQVEQSQKARQTTWRVSLADDSGVLNLWFFNPPNGIAAMLKPGQTLRAFGAVKGGLIGFDMAHPEVTRLPAPLDTALTPVYPAQAGLSQSYLRRVVNEALSVWAQKAEILQDFVPQDVAQAHDLMGLREAVLCLHRPPPQAACLQAAKQRLVFEELLAQQLAMRRWKNHAQQAWARGLESGNHLAQRLRKGLAFTLTQAQERVLHDIGEDLRLARPMRRLVQGDVGSGKTVVAALAACAALEHGQQVALMAPTELLAEQHQRNLSAWFEPLGIAVVALVGSQRSSTRRKALEAVAQGHAGVVTGTHALFQEGVQFHDLGLIVIDEQHRFGVQQRLALSEKGRQGERHPHQLVMTATPIPRTLAMTAYADLDVSVLDELPPGRTPVATAAVPDARRDEVMARLGTACRAGRQAYWVCTLVEESEKLEAKAAEEAHETLCAALPDLRVGLVHGRMKARDKEAVMSAFKAGELDILVATTVIEVGVDVPNASLMVIENAERLGLAQLHQLRGRVGRGAVESSCVLLFSPPLSRIAKERLAVMRESNDGFLIAEKDLELRGPGEFLGTQQTGLARMRFADLARDGELIPQVREAAERVLREHPQAVEPLIQRWVGAGMELAKV
ncbi:MAG: ATP-dependent DNA helicase RecG [Halothiobacillaceae bacterium]